MALPKIRKMTWVVLVLALAVFSLSFFFSLQYEGVSLTGYVLYEDIGLEVSVISPQAQSYDALDTNPLPLYARSNKAIDIDYSVDGGSIYDCCENCMRCTDYLEDLSEGEHELELFFTEQGGATSSQSISFDIAIRPDFTQAKSMQHPYLYYQSADLAELRQRWQDEDAELSDYPVYHLRDWVVLQSDLAEETLPFTHPLYEEVSKANDARALAYICQMEGNVPGPACAYETCNVCDLAKQALLAINESRQSGFYSWYGRWDENTDALIKYSVAYDMMYGNLTNQEREDIELRLATRAAAMYDVLNEDQGHPSGGQGGLDVSTRTMAASALGFLALTIPDFETDSLDFCNWVRVNDNNQTYCEENDRGTELDASAEKWFNYSVDVLFGVDEFNDDYDYWTAYMRGSGFSREGIGLYGGPYDRYQHRDFDRFALAWYHVFGDGPLVELDYYYDNTISLYLPNNDIYNYDAGFNDRYLWTQQAPYILAATQNDADGERRIYHWKQIFEDEPNDWTVKPTAYSSLFSYIMFDEQIKEWFDSSSRTDLEDQSQIFPDAGFAVLKEGSASDDTMIILSADHSFSELSGEEAKQGELVLFSEGVYLIPHLGSFRGAADEGAGSLPQGMLLADPYDGDGDALTDSMFRWGQGQGARNVILVDGRGVDHPDTWPKGDPAYFNQHHFSQNYDYVGLSYNITGDYLSEEANIHRDVLFMNNHDYAVIFDRVRGVSNTHDYAMQLNLGEDDTGVLDVQSQSFTWTYGGASLDAYFITELQSLQDYPTTSADGESYGGCRAYHSCEPSILVRAEAQGESFAYLSILSPRAENDDGLDVQTLTSNNTQGQIGLVNTSSSEDYFALSTSGEDVVLDNILNMSAEFAMLRIEEDSRELLLKEAEYFSFENQDLLVSSTALNGRIYYDDFTITANLSLGASGNMTLWTRGMWNISINITGNPVSGYVHEEGNSFVNFTLSRGSYLIHITNLGAIDYPPQVESLAPEDALISSQQEHTISCRFLDDKGLVNASLLLNESGEWGVYASQAISENQSLNFTVNLSQEGYVWRCQAEDTLGQITRSTTRSLFIRSEQSIPQAPVSETIIPTDGVNTSNGTLVFACRFSDVNSDLEQGWMLIDQEMNMSEELSGSEAEMNATVSLPPGIYQWACEAKDAEGMTHRSQWNELIINNQGVLEEVNEFQGLTTNLSNLSSVYNQSILLEEINYGRIRFDSISTLAGADLDALVEIDQDEILVYSEDFPALNVSAQLVFYGIDYEEPAIQRNGEACPDTICSDVVVIGNELFVNVTHFSRYSVIETYEDDSESSGSSSGGSSSSSSSAGFPSSGLATLPPVEEVLPEDEVDTFEEELSEDEGEQMATGPSLEQEPSAPVEEQALPAGEPLQEDSFIEIEEPVAWIPAIGIGIIMFLTMTVLLVVVMSCPRQGINVPQRYAQQHVAKSLTKTHRKSTSTKANKNISAQINKYVTKKHPFILKNGHKIHSLEELLELLPSFTQEEYRQYVTSKKHDFAHWVAREFKDKSLSIAMKKVTTPLDLADLIVSALEKHQRQKKP